MALWDHCPHRLCCIPPSFTAPSPHGQQDAALCAGGGVCLLSMSPTGCSSRGCCISRHYCINIYVYLLYIYCPGSMHGQAEGSAVLLEVQPGLQAEK